MFSLLPLIQVKQLSICKQLVEMRPLLAHHLHGPCKIYALGLRVEEEPSLSPEGLGVIRSKQNGTLELV